jgi:hypothetical protein
MTEKKYKTRQGEAGAAKLAELRERKKALKEGNYVVKAPIARLDTNVMATTKKLQKGTKYSPQRLRNQINKYLEWCEETDSLPSMKGMAIFLKFTSQTFYNYMKRPEFSDIIETARLHISEWAERDVYSTPGQAAGKIAYMKNVHSWSEKIDSTSTVHTIDLTPEMARAKIEALAPKLLEVLKNSTLLNQLVQPEEAILVEEKK